MMMFNNLREKRLWVEVQRLQDYYLIPRSTEERLSEQLRLFNNYWPMIRSRVPYYRNLGKEKNLPEAFRSWDEVIEAFPVVNRDMVQQYHALLSDETTPPQWQRITGGSTAQPVQLPAWNSERAQAAPNSWLGRSWYGIRPSDRLFLIWGHAQLFGSGWAGLYKRCDRKLRDWLLGYYRFSAYNMDEYSMRVAANLLVQFSPAYMLGYSGALDAFVRANQEKGEILRRLHLKAVIAAAEDFPYRDSAELIQQVMGAPVAMEYGSVETFMIAHTHPEGNFLVFWRSHFIEAIDEGLRGGKKVRITSLYPRCFPLIRYEIGDEIDLGPAEPQLGIERFERVLGRAHDSLALSDGSRVHLTLINDIVRSYAKIKKFQIIQTDGDVVLTVISPNDLGAESQNEILTRLGKINPLLSNISIQKVSTLQQSVAGKTPILLKKDKGK
jgi:phenylacetate-CoA ligase